MTRLLFLYIPHRIREWKTRKRCEVNYSPQNLFFKLNQNLFYMHSHHRVIWSSLSLIRVLMAQELWHLQTCCFMCLWALTKFLSKFAVKKLTVLLKWNPSANITCLQHRLWGGILISQANLGTEQMWGAAVILVQSNIWLRFQK